MRSQRAFSLLETLIAAAIAVAIGWQLLTAFHTIAIGARRLDERLRALDAARRIDERLAADAAGAWSIFVPPVDVLDGANADGHEVDFVTEDAGHRAYWWAYRFDGRARRVTVYTYDPGGAATAGATFDGIAGFTVREHPVSDLFDPRNEAYDPLFAGAAATPAAVPYGWNPAAAGGNGIVTVDVVAAGRSHDSVLASGTSPTRFTIVVEYTPAPVPLP